MCFGAIYWARVKTVYYGAERSDAAEVGFDDSVIYEEIKQGVDDNRQIPFKQVARVTALKVFEAWSSDQDKIMYWFGVLVFLGVMLVKPDSRKWKTHVKSPEIINKLNEILYS